MDKVGASAQAIADALAPTPQAPSARWRWGTVATVNPDGTMNVSIGGSTVPSVRCAQHVMGAKVGDRVRVLYCGTEAMVDAVRASDRLMSLPIISSAILLKDDRFDRDGTAPSSNTYSRIVGIQDKDGENVAYIQAAQYTDGRTGCIINAYNEKSDGTAVGNTINVMVAKDGTRSYSVTDATAFRNAINAVAAYDQSTMNALLQRFNGAGQMWGVESNVINSNNKDYYGKRVSLIFEKDGIFAYNNTDSSSIWRLMGLSGYINLTSTSWAYLVGSSSTVASGNFVRWRCRAGIVFVQVMYRSSAGVSTAEKNVGTIPSGYRPDANAETAAYLGASNDHIGTIWVETGGAVKLAATASASAIYGMLSYPL